MKLLQLPDAYLYNDFDEDLADDSRDTIEVLEVLQAISPRLFPPRACHSTLHHHDLSLAGVLADPATYEVMGIVDWE